MASNNEGQAKVKKILKKIEGLRKVTKKRANQGYYPFE